MYAVFTGEGVEILIPFECRQCGKCCESLSQCVYDPVEKRLIAECELGVFEYLDIRVESGSPVLIKPCPFLVDGKCSIHSFRPESCREFPLGRNFDHGVGCPALKDVLKTAKMIEENLGVLKFAGRLEPKI